MIPMIASTTEYFILKYAKVILWVMVSGGLAALASLIPHFPIETANIYQVGVIAMINGGIAALTSTVAKKRQAALDAAALNVPGIDASSGTEVAL